MAELRERIAVHSRPDASILMKDTEMQHLRSIFLAPYMQLATCLIGKSRHSGGNMFRHQIDTLGILIDYGYIDSVLLKAACIHDVLEDVPDFDCNQILKIDSESRQVYDLVMEVTKKKGQFKSEYLRGIIAQGSTKAKILKCADRISNMISLGFVTSPEFIERYCDETEYFVFPIAIDVNYAMYEELLSLVFARRQFLEQMGYFEAKNHED
jgi:GTP pyrophosphokinase